MLCRDATDRKRAEQALRVAKEFSEKLFTSMQDGLSVIDQHGVHVDVNPALCQMTGFSRNELIGVGIPHPYWPPEEYATIEKAFHATIQGEIASFELTFMRKNGERFQVIVNSSNITDQQGNITHHVATMKDITNRKQAEEELQKSHRQLRALAERQQQIREEAGIMVAREIHDELGGGLTGLKMDLTSVLQKISDAEAGKEERVALMNKIHTSSELIDQMIRVIRRIATGLRPSVLDDLGLIAALEWQLDEFKSRTEITFEFATDFDYVTLEQDTATAVFRIFQEALTNVARHSGATKVTVLLREEDGNLFLKIRDNGRGITEGEMLGTKSLGLLGMRERALVFGGEISIYGKPDKGTTLVLKIPRRQGETS